MKYDDVFNDFLGCKDCDEVFDYLVDNLATSITLWNYFVDWETVLGNIEEIEIDLNTMNYIVGKPEPKQALRKLLKDQPRIIRVIPILIASRDEQLDILVDYEHGDFIYKGFDFRYEDNLFGLPDDQIEKACEFASETGLLDILKKKRIKSIVDYVIGVEVGLGTHGRKNRGGTTMETLVERSVKPLCEEMNWQYITQATASKIKKTWDIDVKSGSRRFDFAIKIGDDKLSLIETNYYSSGGSKLDKTAREYQSLFSAVKNFGHQFIWITDGHGWDKTKIPLRETFDEIDFTLNLNMVASGLLSEIIERRL